MGSAEGRASTKLTGLRVAALKSGWKVEENAEYPVLQIGTLSSSRLKTGSQLKISVTRANATGCF
jgi:hypothetical protein